MRKDQGLASGTWLANQEERVVELDGREAEAMEQRDKLGGQQEDVAQRIRAPQIASELAGTEIGGDAGAGET